MSKPATIAVEPSGEEDISRTPTWETAADQRRWSKGKERDLSEGFPETADFGDSPLRSSYPPTNDEEAEARRVEETLKQWEAAELQRRKAARQSSASSTSPSLVDNVSRRASQLLSGRGRKSGSISDNLGAHARLPTRDTTDSDVVPLATIPASPIPSPSRSTTTLDDPFNPPESQSPFLDPPTASTSSASNTAASPHDPSHTPTSALLPLSPTEGSLTVGGATTTTTRQPPPALPLGLPPPITPPPPLGSPAALGQASRSAGEDDAKPTRWWHEWLCGCGEGSDRGGDHQAGRTNPFE